MSLEHSPARQGGRRASTIDQFCSDHGFSRAKLYGLWSKGKGPRFFKVGTRILISEEAAAEWRHKLEAEAAATAIATGSA